MTLGAPAGKDGVTCPVWMTGRVTIVPRGGPDLPLAPAASSQPMTPTERWPSTAHGLRSLPLRVHAWGQGVSREVSPGPGTPLTCDLEQGGASGRISSFPCSIFFSGASISLTEIGFLLPPPPHVSGDPAHGPGPAVDKGQVSSLH